MPQAQYDSLVSSDLLIIPRGEFSIEDPWSVPAVSQPARLRRSTDGAVPRLATTVAAYYDDRSLTVVFAASDDHVVATHLAHDAPLYEEDVFEIFIAPERLAEYFEIEINPLATTFDARIESPDGERATMRADVSWSCEGLFAAVRHLRESNGASSTDAVLRIPFASLSRFTPSPDDTWRANFFRIDRHQEAGDEFSAWQPTLRRPADFHVPSAFGRLRFS